jgi:hypothetical protein
VIVPVKEIDIPSPSVPDGAGESPAKEGSPA